VLLRPGAAPAPIFFLHGVGGHCDEFRHLVALLDTAHPCVGLQARGTDGSVAPLDSVDAMAEHHLAQMTAMQATGPYLLVGHSFGALVAVEIARRIRDRGDSVGLLVLLDGFPDRPYMPIVPQLRLIVRRMIWRLSGRNRPVSALDGLDANISAVLRQVTDDGYAALHRYRPRYYPGPVVFVRPAIPTIFPHDPTPVWAPVVAGFELETVPGNHLTMLTTHAADLAAVLGRRLQGATPVPAPA
jgi:thioesterase domain-containing protein